MSSDSTLPDPPLGAIVTTSSGRGVVRFKGPTSFSTGKWFGVELDDNSGKNDGSVNGVPYFTCEQGYGIFIRASAIRAVHGLERDTAPPPQRPAPASRPTPGHQRVPSTSTSTLLRPGPSSARGPPSSSGSAASTRSASPAKPSIATATLAPSSSSSSTAALGRSSSTRASPTKPGLSAIRRPSATSSRAPPAQDSPLSPPAASRGASAPTHAKRASLSMSISASAGGTIPPRRTSSPLSQAPIQATASQPAPRPSSRLSSQPSLLPAEVQMPPPPPPAPIADETELHELRAKIRVLEAKRADDSRHVRELETRLSDAEAFVALRPKLQAKLNQLQTDLIATKRELADAQQISQLAEGRVIDAQEQLEMVLLDKEVAEERAELAETELEDVKEKLAILEVEVDVLKEEGHIAADNPVAKDSLAYIQLEKQNERLKEALIKLRDMSQETEQDQRRRISEMERDVSEFESLQAQYDETSIKLSNAEVQIEDLKLQLDDALGAEDMLVQLTERNLMLGEKIEEMRITIEDLESLKELSDELEENHVETEKQLHEDIQAKEMQIREHARRIEQLEETCTDYENTITQFRELVMQLQTELDQLRTQTQTAQTESATAASQAANVMSLNIKLQSSAQKNQARTIDLEVKSIEAKECRELLNIVQPYLPQLYVESDWDATSCYLFFRRMAYKAGLINTVVAQMHNLPEALNGDVSDVLVGVCEMRGRITGLATLCKRFAAVLRHCDVEAFLNIGRLFPEIAPLEKRIDMHIDLLRRDEFRDMECVSDIAKIQAQFEHLAETYFDGFDTDLAERELGYIAAFDHDLDMFAASLSLTRTSVAGLIGEDDVEVEMGGYDVEAELFAPISALLGRCKSAKTASRRMMKRLEELAQEGAAVKPHVVPQMKAMSNHISELVDFGITLAQQVMPHLRDARASKTAFQLPTVLAVMKQAATGTVAKDMKPGASPWEAINDAVSQLIEESSKLIQPLMEAENVLKISGTAPWVARISEIKAALAVNVEAERKVATLTDEMQGLARTLRAKEQTVQEAGVKIELMERRLEAVRKQAETISELEGELVKARKQERAYEEAMEQLQTDLDGLEQENAKLKTMTAGQERQAGGPQAVEPENVPIEGSLETTHLVEQIEALRGTVRFLRTENSYLKGYDLLKEIEELPPLVVPRERAPTPPLAPSGLSDTDESEPDEGLSLAALRTETKRLYRDVLRYSSAPRVVDLGKLNEKRAAAGGGKVWVRRAEQPGTQVLMRRQEGTRLQRRVSELVARTRDL